MQTEVDPEGNRNIQQKGPEECCYAPEVRWVAVVGLSRAGREDAHARGAPEFLLRQGCYERFPLAQVLDPAELAWLHVLLFLQIQRHETGKDHGVDLHVTRR